MRLEARRVLESKERRGWSGEEGGSVQVRGERFEVRGRRVLESKERGGWSGEERRGLYR